MKRTLLTVGLLALAVPAMATGIPKWRTPDGTLHFGQNPPAGSVLVERIPLADRGTETSVEEQQRLREARERAAADGREIMRRRAAEREAAREREVTVAPRRDAVVDRDVVFVTPGVAFRPLERFHPPIGFDRPKHGRKPFHRVQPPPRAPVPDSGRKQSPGRFGESRLSIAPNPARSHGSAQ